MQLFRRTKNLVGLDIGSSAVKAVELKPAGKGFRVTAFGIEPLPPDSIVDGAIIDGGAVIDAIQRLFYATRSSRPTTSRRRCRATPSSSRRSPCRR